MNLNLKDLWLASVVSKNSWCMEHAWWLRNLASPTAGPNHDNIVASMRDLDLRYATLRENAVIWCPDLTLRHKPHTTSCLSNAWDQIAICIKTSKYRLISARPLQRYKMLRANTISKRIWVRGTGHGFREVAWRPCKWKQPKNLNGKQEQPIERSQRTSTWGCEVVRS